MFLSPFSTNRRVLDYKLFYCGFCFTFKIHPNEMDFSSYMEACLNKYILKIVKLSLKQWFVLICTLLLYMTRKDPYHVLLNENCKDEASSGDYSYGGTSKSFFYENEYTSARNLGGSDLPQDYIDCIQKQQMKNFIALGIILFALSVALYIVSSIYENRILKKFISSYYDAEIFFAQYAQNLAKNEQGLPKLLKETKLKILRKKIREKENIRKNFSWFYFSANANVNTSKTEQLFDLVPSLQRQMDDMSSEEHDDLSKLGKDTLGNLLKVKHKWKRKAFEPALDSTALNHIFWYGNPQFYFSCVLWYMMCLSFYYAWLFVNFAAYHAPVWMKVVSFVICLFSTVLYFVVVIQASRILAITAPDYETLTSVVDEAEDINHIFEDIRTKLLDKMASLGGDPLTKLTELFAMIDDNGNETLSREEFGLFIGSCGIHFSARKWIQIFQKVDLNCDNEISLNEFKLFLFPEDAGAYKQEIERVKSIKKSNKDLKKNRKTNIMDWSFFSNKQSRSHFQEMDSEEVDIADEDFHTFSGKVKSRKSLNKNDNSKVAVIETSLDESNKNDNSKVDVIETSLDESNKNDNSKVAVA